MSYSPRDYTDALARIRSAPLSLSEKDFTVLHDFNPADERRGREALRRAQLEVVTPPVTRQTKAIDPPAPTPAWKVRTDLLLDSVGKLAAGVGAQRDQIAALTARVAELEAARDERPVTPPRRASAVDVH